jgi:hypothetical protein
VPFVGHRQRKSSAGQNGSGGTLILLLSKLVSQV